MRRAKSTSMNRIARSPLHAVARGSADADYDDHAPAMIVFERISDLPECLINAASRRQTHPSRGNGSAQAPPEENLASGNNVIPWPATILTHAARKSKHTSDDRILRLRAY